MLAVAVKNYIQSGTPYFFCAKTRGFQIRKVTQIVKFSFFSTCWGVSEKNSIQPETYQIFLSTLLGVPEKYNSQTGTLAISQSMDTGIPNLTGQIETMLGSELTC